MAQLVLARKQTPVLAALAFPQAESWPPELRKAQAYEQILLDIILGVLSPGSRLDEHALTEHYGAGLAGIRNALGRLSLEGMVIRRARAGTTVASLDLVELREGYEARALIEPHCAALAAGKATRLQLSEILPAFDGGEAAALLKDCTALVAMDQRFHASIARASGNASLARVLIPCRTRRRASGSFPWAVARRRSAYATSPLTGLSQHG